MTKLSYRLLTVLIICVIGQLFITRVNSQSSGNCLENMKCLNGGICVETWNNGYRCQCPLFYTGIQCEFHVLNYNECGGNKWHQIRNENPAALTLFQRKTTTCYRYFDNQLEDYHSARLRCLNEGGVLISTYDRNRHSSLLIEKQVDIWLNRFFTENPKKYYKWTWDGYPQPIMNYKDYDYNYEFEDDYDLKEICPFQIGDSGTVQVDKCRNKKAFICEKTVDTNPSIQLFSKTPYCPDTFLYSTKYKRCFKYFHELKNKKDAQTTCKNFNSYLPASIDRRHLFGINQLAVLEANRLGCGLNSPCRNGASCLIVNDKRICQCSPSFEGEFCQFTKNNTDHCLSGPTGPCQTFQKCTTTEVGFVCHCPENYIGDQCEEYDPCYPDKCGKNSIDCVKNEPGSRTSFQCICSDGYYGVTCENYNPCYNNPCGPGICIQNINTYYCNCSYGLSEVRCVSNTSTCPTSRCNDKGKCSIVVTNITTYVCNCFPGYKGKTCESYDPCYSNPCRDGYCQPKKGTDIGFECINPQRKIRSIENVTPRIRNYNCEKYQKHYDSETGCKKLCNCSGSENCDSKTGICPTESCNKFYYGSTCDRYYQYAGLWVDIFLNDVGHMVLPNGEQIYREETEIGIENPNGLKNGCLVTSQVGDFSLTDCSVEASFICESKVDLSWIKPKIIFDKNLFSPINVPLTCKIPDYLDINLVNIYWKKDGVLYSFPNSKSKVTIDTNELNKQIFDNYQLKFKNPLLIEGTYSCVVDYAQSKKFISEDLTINLNGERFKTHLRLSSALRTYTYSGMVFIAKNVTSEIEKRLRNLASRDLGTHQYIIFKLDSIKNGSILLENTLFIQDILSTIIYKRYDLQMRFQGYFNKIFIDTSFIKILKTLGNFQIDTKYFRFGEIDANQCLMTTLPASTNKNYNYPIKFPAVGINQISVSLKKCLNGKPIATGVCKYLYNDGKQRFPELRNFKWMNITECFPKSNNKDTEMLREVSQISITEQNLLSVSKMTKNLTNRDLLKSNDIGYTSLIMENALDSELRPTESVTENFVWAANNILRSTSSEDIINSDILTGSSKKIMEIIENFAKTTNLENNKDSIRFFTPRISIDVEMTNDMFDFNSFQVYNKAAGLLENQTIYSKTVKKADELNQSTASIYFEQSLKQLHRPTRLVLTIYSDVKFFLRNNSKTTANKPSSQIISASFGDYSMTGIDPPICVIFQPIKRYTDEELIKENVKCVFWDTVTDSWSTDGCWFARKLNGRVFCQCSHFTNFAILIDVERTPTTNTALSILSIIGLALSIAGLGYIILSFIVFQQARKSKPQITLFNLALALLAVDIVFLVGIKRTENHGACLAVAALLYYFLLVSFLWMLTEGVLAYLHFVKIFDSYVGHFLIKATICCWSIPTIPIIIIAIVDRELFVGYETFCWLDSAPFYYGFLIPICIIIIGNFVILCLTMKTLCKRPITSSSQTTLQRQISHIRAFIFFVFVMGTTWIFGFLAVKDTKIAFQVIFCILNAFQGFFLFILYIFREKKVCRGWLNLCVPCFNVSKDKQTMSSTSPFASKETMIKNKTPKSSIDHTAMMKNMDNNFKTDLESNPTVLIPRQQISALELPVNTSNSHRGSPRSTPRGSIDHSGAVRSVIN